jgi:hypothetical protein
VGDGEGVDEFWADLYWLLDGAIEGRGLTQVAVAEGINVSTTRLSHLKRGMEVEGFRSTVHDLNAFAAFVGLQPGDWVRALGLVGQVSGVEVAVRYDDHLSEAGKAMVLNAYRFQVRQEQQALRPAAKSGNRTRKRGVGTEAGKARGEQPEPKPKPAPKRTPKPKPEPKPKPKPEQ